MNSKPAYSLIFAFIITTVMMLVAVTSIQNTTDKIAYYRDLEGGTQAYLAAQSAAEEGVVAMKNRNPGYEASASNAFTQDADEDGTSETYANYAVYAKAAHNTNDSTATHWYLPIPGSGTAGSADDDCDVTASTDAEVDHPCNWNKLLYGQNVTIPLYTDDGSGGLLFPYDFPIGFSGWSLKIRTPCQDSTEDPLTCTRIELDDGVSGDGYNYDDDASLILWQITGTGTDPTGNTVDVEVVPDDAYYSFRSVPSGRETSNTEIYESLINSNSSAGDYLVLSANTTSTAPDSSELYYACMGDTDANTSNGNEITYSSLTLHLDVVTAPKEVTTNENVPYLEWQLVYDSTRPLADNKSVIVGEGYHQGTEHIFYYPFTVTRSTTGESSSIYTLSN